MTEKLAELAEETREVDGDALMKMSDKELVALIARLEPHAARDENAQGPAKWDPLESTCRHASLSIL